MIHLDAQSFTIMLASPAGEAFQTKFILPFLCMIAKEAGGRPVPVPYHDPKSSASKLFEDGFKDGLKSFLWNPVSASVELLVLVAAVLGFISSVERPGRAAELGTAEPTPAVLRGN